MHDKNFKILKYSNIILLVVAILLVAYSILIGYLLIQSASQNLSGTLTVYLAVFLAVFLVPASELIFLLVCLVLMLKNKPLAYFGTGLISLFVFGDAINNIVQMNIELNLEMIFTSIFWIALIVLSFYMYRQTKNLKRKKNREIKK
jgi:glucan phosphoethanolaminetransferase (alkaline phosphatase superfamily)